MEGWLFDAYPVSGGMRVWVIAADGACRSFVDPWSPAFYAGACGARAALSLAQKAPFLVSTAWTEKRELFSGETLPVMELRVPPLARDALAARLRDADVPLYGADIHLVQAYHYERGHFPLARCAFELDGVLVRVRDRRRARPQPRAARQADFGHGRHRARAGRR